MQDTLTYGQGLQEFYWSFPHYFYLETFLKNLYSKSEVRRPRCIYKKTENAIVLRKNKIKFLKGNFYSSHKNRFVLQLKDVTLQN